MDDLARDYLVYAREVKFYKDLASKVDVRTPHPYYVEFNEKENKVILLLEFMDGWHTPDQISGASEEEIFKAIEVLRKYSKSENEITLLHCNSAYPTPMEDVNLLSMNYLKKQFNVDVGYSDHTQGIDISLAAVAIGATVIEKHFTIDKSMEGPDHSSSLDPNELKMMIKGIRNIEISLQGQSSKTVTKSEMVNKIHVRKSICYNENLKKGEILTEDKVIMLRPGDGISPMKVTSFIGKKCNKNLVKYDKLKKTDFD